MSFTENQVYEALGIEPPAAAQGAQGQEVADPATQSSAADATDTGSNADTGAQGQEVADPAGEDANTVPGTETEPTAGSAEPESPAEEVDTGTGTDNTPMTPEQRRQNAARRRQQEQQAAINQAVSNALAAERERSAEELKTFFESIGMTNTVTGKPITNMEEFKQWKEQHGQSVLDRNLKAGKLTTEDLNFAISQHPAVKRAAEMTVQAKQAQDSALQAQQTAAQQLDMQRIDQELAEIHKLDTSISTVADLLTMPKNKEFRDKVSKGYSFIDAYRLVHHQEIEAKVADAARQKALNDARGKDHLNQTGNSRGGGAETVPSGDMELYRLLNPNATAAQIQAHYNKYKK